MGKMKNNKMYLHLDKKVNSELSTQLGLDGVERIDIMVKKSDLAPENEPMKVELSKGRLRYHILQDEEGNEHLVAAIPGVNIPNTSYDVLMTTKHGKLVEHDKSISARFNFRKDEKDVADKIEDEVSEMADFLCEGLA